tara:strand:+ start:733 stop:1590 length:858 start_codon:yes stop_codon:yes gene_type:complete
MNKDKIGTIMMVGLGHIGGSLSLAIKKTYKDKVKIIGVDRNKKTLLQAKKTKKFAALLSAPRAKEVEASDVIFLCVSIKQIPTILKSLSKTKLKQNAVVTDVVSTKEEILSLAKKFLPKKTTFVGGHPIAGSEASGFLSANPKLFEKKIFIAAGAKGRRAGILKIKSIWKGVGSRVVNMSPKEHDKIFSLLSHTPHILSFGLGKITNSKLSKKEIDGYAGTSYKDLTRISSSSTSLWAEIFMSNKKNLLADIALFKRYLVDLEKAIRKNNNRQIIKAINQTTRKP